MREAIEQHISLVIECEERLPDSAWRDLPESDRAELIAATARKAMQFIDDCLSQAHKQLEGAR